MRSPTRTPSTRPHGRSVPRKGVNEVVVHERVIHDAGASSHIVYPTLTSTNYIEWAQVMKINLRA